MKSETKRSFVAEFESYKEKKEAQKEALYKLKNSLNEKFLALFLNKNANSADAQKFGFILLFCDDFLSECEEIAEAKKEHSQIDLSESFSQMFSDVLNSFDKSLKLDLLFKKALSKEAQEVFKELAL